MLLRKRAHLVGSCSGTLSYGTMETRPRDLWADPVKRCEHTCAQLQLCSRFTFLHVYLCGHKRLGVSLHLKQ